MRGLSAGTIGLRRDTMTSERFLGAISPHEYLEASKSFSFRSFTIPLYWGEPDGERARYKMLLGRESCCIIQCLFHAMNSIRNRLDRQESRLKLYSNLAVKRVLKDEASIVSLSIAVLLPYQKKPLAAGIMYTVGLQSAADAFLMSSFKVQVVLALLILFALLVFGHGSQTDDISSQTPVYLPGSHLLAIAPFFQRRFDFLNDGFRKTGQNLFQFNMLRETVIVVSGETGRKAFFANRAFDLTEGFKVLSGAIPVVKGVTSDLQTRRIALIHKRLASVQKNDHLSQLIVPILEDCRRVMDSWGANGIYDPFEKIYELLFQTTVRSLTSEEIASDPALVARLKNLYDILDSGTTPTTVLLPWLPGPSMLKKLLATKEVYNIVSHAIDTRVKNGVPKNDTLQMLIDEQDERLVMVGFIMGLLVAGARATGTTASWLITFLGNNPEWRDKAIFEIEQLLSMYPPQAAQTTSLSSHLASIPLEVWEGETPVMDALIHETLRIAQPHTAMRRNLGPDTVIDSKTIPSGAYVVYPFSDVHLNPELYPDPWKFDPNREEVKTPFGYLGWGGGKTVCLGQRLARLELKLITSMMLLGFRYSIVDSKSARLDPLPRPNWNDILLCRPEKGTCYLTYEKAVLSL